MDNQILIVSGISCMIYILAQIIVFRLVDENQALPWLGKLYVIVEGISLVAVYKVFPPDVFFVFTLWHGAIVTLFVVAYILTIFSFTEASITMRLLTEIAKTRNGGATRQQIVKVYNRDFIVHRRLSRFMAGGDIVQSGSLYIWKKSISPFILRERMLSVLLLMFPRLDKSA